ncbi:MAG: glycoside hydrolase, partial [Pseudomonadota bacterium]
MRTRAYFSALVAGLLCAAASAQQIDAAQYQGLSWRHIGPFRGGRTVAAQGVPTQPNVFYIGVNNGGVWKTTDYGHTWKPIFDQQSTGSIGNLAVALSNPNTIYVGSGEALHRPDLSTGDGMYRSDDAGVSWKHLGLRDAQQINTILVDPKNDKRIFVAVLGHPYGANTERGVYRSNDGGEHFEKVLYQDEHTGAIGLAMHPTDSNIIYASLWAARQAPWENGAFSGTGSGLFKSSDGGNTWQQLKKGLPDKGLGRIAITVAPSSPDRLYAQVSAGAETGTYRSDDAGANWFKVNDEERVSGRPDDFAEIKVHPTNPDIVYVANVATQRSNDGGKSWTAIRGAPGGDDYHGLWINPLNPDIILNAS